MKTYISVLRRYYMLATVHVPHPQPSAICGYLRVGHTGHRRLEALHAAGTLKFNRFVFDAAHIDEQIVLLKALKGSGCEVVLDPNFAEMATVGQFESSVTSAEKAISILPASLRNSRSNTASMRCCPPATSSR